MYISAKGREKRIELQWGLRNQLGSLPPISSPVSVKLDLYFSTLGKHDIDNFNKLILDACNNILWRDDNQIKRLTVTKYCDKDYPRMELSVREIIGDTLFAVRDKCEHKKSR